MRHVSCARVARWLPLYVGGDLDAHKKSARVAEHLRRCDGCARAAEELRATRDDLRLYAPPPFDEKFYDSLRGAVLREINEPARNPDRSSLIDVVFGARRFAFAVPLIALVICVALFAATVPSPKDRAVKSGGDATARDASRPSPSQSDAISGAAPANIPNDAAPTGEKKMAAGRAAPPARRFLTARRRRAPVVVAASSAAPQIDSVVSSAIGTAAPIYKVSGETKKFDDSLPPAAPEATRIEIQTADPNVRIIWLAPVTRP